MSGKVDPAKDPKYMLQVITSAIVNTPPPPAVITMVATLGKKRHKVGETEWATDSPAVTLNNFPRADASLRSH